MKLCIQNAQPDSRNVVKSILAAVPPEVIVVIMVAIIILFVVAIGAVLCPMSQLSVPSPCEGRGPIRL